MITIYAQDEDFEIGVQTYLVTDKRKVTKYIDDEIGVDYECEQGEDGSWVITVFEQLQSEHLGLRKFITDNELWSQ